MSLSKNTKFFLALGALYLGVSGLVFGGSAAGVFGLYYTGVNDSGALLGDGVTDSHWSVSYARVNGTGSTSSAFTGASYVVSSSVIDAGWVPNSSTSRWITAPGATTVASGGTTNTGGDYLPGNGTSGTNSAYFVYRLSFIITGAGGNGSAVTNNVSVSLTIAADDQYSVYVNPASAPTVNNAGTINAGGTASSGGGTNAWGNTSSITLEDNFGANNVNFVIGTNTIYVVVANTNSQTGTNGSAALNPSGLLVYQVGSMAVIDGTPVPEVGTWLPLTVALGFFGWRGIRRRTIFPS